MKKSMGLFTKFQHGIRMVLEIWRGYAYRSNFPESKLVGIPKEIGRYSLIDYGGV